MNAIRFYLSDGTPAEVWQCGRCKSYRDIGCAPVGKGDKTYSHEERLKLVEESAERCCNYRCLNCGEKADQFHDLCRKCSSANWAAESAAKEAESFARATERTDYEGPFVYDERFFETIDDVIEHCECHDVPPPEYLWVPEIMAFKIDAERIVENALDNHHEDAMDHIDEGMQKELQAFLDDWCDRTGVTSLDERHKEYVRVPKEAS